MKSEKFILKFLRCQFQDLDLRANGKTKGGIADLRDSQPCPGQNSRHALPGFMNSGACQTSDSSGGARYRAEISRLGKAHGNGPILQCNPDVPRRRAKENDGSFQNSYVFNPFAGSLALANFME
jgi:hypothetical protein